MTLLHLSIVANIVLSVVIIIFAIDRQYFHKTCQLRHNPIDKAIARIEDRLVELRSLLINSLKSKE